MKKTASDKLSDRLVKAFLKNKIISPLPSRYTKKLIEADKFRKICESKIKCRAIRSWKRKRNREPYQRRINTKRIYSWC